MLEFAHVLTGAVIAYKIPSPALSLPLCLLTHFLIDKLPHWNFALEKEKKKRGKITNQTIFWLYLDSLFGLFSGLFVASRVLPSLSRFLLVIVGAFLAVLPDLIEAPFFFFNSKNKFIKQVLAFQKAHQWSLPFWPGIIFQFLYFLLLILLVI